MKMIKRNDYDNGCHLQKIERLMFRRLLRCFTSSWIEFLRQALNISTLNSHFSREAIQLIQSELLKEEEGGFFNLT